MRKICYALTVVCMVLCMSTYSRAQVSIGIGTPNVSIGINFPVYPELVRIPSYPVYYAPRVDANYFFYDGMYWVFQGDAWYSSFWYNGPWRAVAPEYLPYYILRVPVRYYRHPPAYFRGWQPNAPPRWNDHWGPGWSKQRSGWDQWNRQASPQPAPLPTYQRKYSGERYPQMERQQRIHSDQYRYQPRSSIVREQYKGGGGKGHGGPPHGKKDRGRPD